MPEFRHWNTRDCPVLNSSLSKPTAEGGNAGAASIFSVNIWAGHFETERDLPDESSHYIKGLLSGYNKRSRVQLRWGLRFWNRCLPRYCTVEEKFNDVSEELSDHVFILLLYEAMAWLCFILNTEYGRNSVISRVYAILPDITRSNMLIMNCG